MIPPLRSVCEKVASKATIVLAVPYWISRIVDPVRIQLRAPITENLHLREARISGRHIGLLHHRFPESVARRQRTSQCQVWT